jgi:hypothetical protein
MSAQKPFGGEGDYEGGTEKIRADRRLVWSLAGCRAMDRPPWVAGDL